SNPHRLGFKIVSYQILGLPNESLDSMVQTLAFNARLPVLLGASPFYRTPNSPIARSLELNEGDFVKARLTALAIETDNFTRDDIYTLFVTTRILNFLKGLPVSADVSLEELMNHPFSDPRARIGLELLSLTARTGRLYFATRAELVENKHFRADLFQKVMSSAATVACQNGRIIDVRSAGFEWNASTPLLFSPAHAGED
ncbi:MAG TPA: B12-binding domain-containing radical SAM protein, partial [Candidatus Binatia bacterium]